MELGGAVSGVLIGGEAKVTCFFAGAELNAGAGAGEDKKAGTTGRTIEAGDLSMCTPLSPLTISAKLVSALLAEIVFHLRTKGPSLLSGSQ